MGYDTQNILPTSTKESHVRNLIGLMGYVGKGDFYYFYKDEDYKYFEGVTLFIGRLSEKENSNLIVETHTSIWGSNYDKLYQNETVRQLKLYFGGTFYTDYGKGRYLKADSPKNCKAENGCYFAYFNLSNQFTSAYMFLNKINESESEQEIKKIMPSSSYLNLSTNIITTYFASVIENFFRDTYIALLKYSNKKESIFKNIRLNSMDLLSISKGEKSIEEAVAFTLSFQNIHRINSIFKELDNNIDIYGTLSKPYRNRKETLFSTVDRVLEHRHGVVHRMDLKNYYSKDDALRDLNSLEIALRKVYFHICKLNNWKYE